MVYICFVFLGGRSFYFGFTKRRLFFVVFCVLFIWALLKKPSGKICSRFTGTVWMKSKPAVTTSGNFHAFSLYQ